MDTNIVLRNGNSHKVEDESLKEDLLVVARAIYDSLTGKLNRALVEIRSEIQDLRKRIDDLTNRPLAVSIDHEALLNTLNNLTKSADSLSEMAQKITNPNIELKPEITIEAPRGKTTKSIVYNQNGYPAQIIEES